MANPLPDTENPEVAKIAVAWAMVDRTLIASNTNAAKTESESAKLLQHLIGQFETAYKAISAAVAIDA